MFGFGKSKELEKNFRRLAQVLDAVDIPIWQRDEKLNIIFCNNKYLEIAGIIRSTEDIIELSKEIRVLAEAALSEKKPQIKRLKIIVEGARKDFIVHEIPFEGWTIGYATDAVALVKIEEELKHHEEVQKQLLETSASAIAVYGPDQHLKFFNNAFMNLWKLDESWLYTQPTYSEILEALREKRRLPEQANFAEFKRKNIAMFQEVIEAREEYYFLPDDRALRVIVVPHALGGLQMVFEDMTDKLALERKYNTLLDVQTETLANLHEGVAVFEESGKLALSNAVFARMWGLDTKFLDSEPFFADILERTKDHYRYEKNWEKFKKAMVARTLSRIRISDPVELVDGRIINIKTTPLPDGEILVTFDDITDSFLVERSLREANQALEDADRLKTEFLTNVSYELRSPLTSIMGFTEVLRQEIFGTLNSTQKNYLEDIHQASKQLESLINDVLDIASIEAGYMKLEIEKFDVHAMLASVIALVKERIEQAKLKFEFDCQPDIGKIFGDEKRIRQVVFNLLTNAIKFTEASGSISLSCQEHSEDDIIISITDTGRGIPQDEINKVFQKFYKVKGKSGGTGLGLAIAKNFIDLHGGRINIESEIGKGTKVTIILPRNQNEEN